MSALAEMLNEAVVARQIEEEIADQRVQIVAQPRWVKRIEQWRGRQSKIPTRSEAIRQLVDEALDAREKAEKLETKDET